jgi:hypothetical protein
MKPLAKSLRSKLANPLHPRVPTQHLHRPKKIPSESRILGHREMNLIRASIRWFLSKNYLVYL